MSMFTDCLVCFVQMHLANSGIIVGEENLENFIEPWRFDWTILEHTF